MLSIMNNVAASNTARIVGKTYGSLSRSVERLSSGKRVNKASDDPAAMAVGELLRADVAGHVQSRRNAIDARSMTQIADGACQQIQDILVRMEQLAHQAATDTYSADQKTMMQEEFDQLNGEITRIAESVEFNGNKLLSGGGAPINAHLGSSQPEDLIPVRAADLTAESLGLGNPDRKRGSTIAMNRQDVPVSSVDDPFVVANGGVGDSSLRIEVKDIDSGAIIEDHRVFAAPGETLSLAQVVVGLNRSAGRQVASAIEVIEGKWTLKAEAASVGKNSAWIAGGNGMEWVAGGLVVYGDSRGTDGDPWLWRDLADGTTDARDAVDQAIRAVADYRAMLGATENRLGHAAGVLGVEAETKLASQSRIIDVDVAKEMGQMTRQQVLAQAGTSLLSQASTMPEMALHLLS